MRWLFAGLIVLHGLIHFMGVAKGFGLAELPELARPVSRGMAVLWLAAAVAMVGAGILYVTTPRTWWVVGTAAVVLSQAAIVSSWGDAKFGTIMNLLVLALVVYGFATRGPLGFRAEYRDEVAKRLHRSGPDAPGLVTEADVARLPAPVARYVELSGAVGRPRALWFRAEWRGRIRGGPGDPWMSFEAEQHSFPAEPARFFRMDARRGGLPVEVLHAFRAGEATMRVRLVSMIPLVNARGPDLTRAETVTLFNDLCVLAPGELADPAIEWEPIDSSSAAARYAVGPNAIRAVLHFNDDGELVDFVSDDRLMASADGTGFTRVRWSTPLSRYRSYGPRRAASRGEGRWHPPEGEFPYIELELLDLEVHGRAG